MEKILKLYTYIDGVNDTPFPNSTNAIEIYSFNYDAKRMGGAPTINASIKYPLCLDDVWNDNVYATFNGERYFLKQTPTSSYSNDDTRYKHDLELISERVVLDNVYFYDVVASDTTNDKPVSNSSNVVFFGDIHEFAKRLNYSLQYANLDYSVVVDEGITSEGKLMSFQDYFFSNVLQEIYNTYEIPYYFVGKVIHIGKTNNAIDDVFKYGANDALLSISKNNANYKIVNRATGIGSSDNIPYYYPNNSEKGVVELTFNASDDSDLTPTLGYIDYNKLSKKVEIGSRYTFKETTKYPSITNGTILWRSRDELDLDNTTDFTPIQLGQSINVSDLTQSKDIVHDFRLNISLSDESIVNFSFLASIDGEGGHFTFADFATVWLYSANGDLVAEWKKLTTGEISTTTKLQGGDYYLELLGLNLNKPYPVLTTYSYALEYFTSSITSVVEPTYAWVNENGEELSNLHNIGIDYVEDITNDIGKYFVVQIPYRIAPQANLMPPIYRDSFGAERFYNALNDSYVDTNGNSVVFENEFVEGKPKEHIASFDDIKPSIVGMTNAQGLRMDMFSEFAYDTNDNDEIDEEGNYVHPYFFAKLRKLDGEFGFNLFDHAIDESEMTISMTSGNCGACQWIIGVESNTQKNIVQVNEDGTLKRDSNGNVLRSGTPQDIQNDTINNEVWIALKKDIDTFGVIMPNASANYKPSVGDTFVILHIDLPKAYILNAEERLKQAIIDYIALNNSEKFTFSIKFSRIYFAQNPTILSTLSENSAISIEYDEKIYNLYVSSYNYKINEGDALPEISVELSNSLVITPNALQSAINSTKKEIIITVEKNYTDDTLAKKVESELAQLDYLKESLAPPTNNSNDIQQKTTLVLGYTNDNSEFTPMSGSNGVYDATKLGGGIATFWGGGMYDKADYYDWNGQEWVIKDGVTMPNNIAKGLIRFDGTGYLSNGAFWWDKNGVIYADPTALLLNISQESGDETFADIILSIRNELATLNDLFEYDADNKVLYLKKDNDGNSRHFVSYGDVVAGGYTEGGGGGGEGGATTLGGLNNVDSSADSTPTTDKVLVRLKDSSHWTLADLASLVGLDEEALATYLTTNQYAKQSDIPSLSGYAKESYVDDAIATLVGTAPSALDTIYELAQAIQDNESVVDALNQAIGLKANASDLANYLPLSGGMVSGVLGGTGKIRVNTSNSVNSYGYLKATAYGDSLNRAVMDIGSNYGGTSDINSDVRDVTAMSIYRGVVGLGRAYTYAELYANQERGISLAVSGDITSNEGQHTLSAKLDKATFDNIFGIDEDGNIYIKKDANGNPRTLWNYGDIVAGGYTEGGSTGGGGLIQTVYGYDSLGGTFNNTNLTDTFNAYTINAINERFNNYATLSALSSTLENYVTTTALSSSLALYQPLISESNKLAYSLISGTPTSLPASDVYAWAKASSKPTYTTTEVSEGTNLYFTNARAVSALSSTLANYALSSSLASYLPLSGGSLSGSLTFANGTWNNVGDDVAIGDYNAAGSLGIKSLNNDTPNIGFHNSSGTLLGTLTANGTTLQWSSNTIIHSGNIGSQSVNYATSAGNATTASRLANSVTLWGQSFDGSGNVDGSLYANGTIASSSRLRVNASGSTANFGFLKAETYSTNRGILHIGSNYGATTNIDATNADVVSISMYRGCVGVGRQFTGAELYSNYSNGTRLYIDGNTIGTGEITAGSDIRYKFIENYVELKTEDIANAPIFNFRWMDRVDDNVHLGTSAQYWKGITPFAVSHDKMKDFYTLNYGSVGVAIGVSNARKLLSHEERIEQLERENKELRNELNQLRYGIE